LAGVTSAGVLMAIFQSNAGGAWDNAKKMFEEGVDINGKTYYKGSEPHKATVVGDTVGDPFKDTSGPSLNILLKLMSVVALVIAPSIALDLPASTDLGATVIEMTQTVEEPVLVMTLVEELDENGNPTGVVDTVYVEGPAKGAATNVLSTSGGQ